jgi:hypothetical protein
MMTRTGLATTIAMLLGATAAGAVTPEEAWESFRGFQEKSGQTVTTTSVARDGDTLVVEGLEMSVSSPDGSASRMTVGTLRFRDAGGGTVDVIFPDSYDMAMTVPPTVPGAATGMTDIRLVFGQPDARITISGPTNALVFAYDAPTTSVELAEVRNALGPVDLNISASLLGTTGTYTLDATGTVPAMAGKSVTASAKIDASGADADGGTTFAVDVAIEEFSIAFDGAFPPELNEGDPASFLKAGFRMDAGLAMGATTYDVQVVENAVPTRVAGTLASGKMDFGMGAERLFYDILTTGATLAMTVPDLPTGPVDLSAAELGLSFAMPVLKSATPQEFRFGYRLVDIVLPEAVWSIADPTRALPRDPLSFVLDSSGTARLDVDFNDQAARAAAGPPGALLSLDLASVTASGLGALFSGAGALTFDNSDTVTYDGMPAPTGTLTFNASGVNALIDTLVGMGVVPEGDLTGLRLALAMIAKPGPDPDTLTSAIEFRGAELYVNGQRLR